MAVKRDPLTTTRRQAFRDYCKNRGWQNAGVGTWHITAISQAVGKAPNKVSDLLNGTGSFGAKIARDIEEKLGLPVGAFDSFGADGSAIGSILNLKPVEAQLVQMYRCLGETEQRRALELVNGMLKTAKPKSAALEKSSV